MLEIFAKIGLINCIVSSYLGALILLRGRNTLEKWSFSLLAFVIAFWSFGYWQWLSSNIDVIAYVWIQIFTFASILIPFFYYFWILSLLGLHKKYFYLTLALVILSLSLIFSIFYTNLVIKGVTTKLMFPFWPIPGSLYIYYVLFLYLGLISLSCWILYTTKRKTNNLVLKSQINYIFWGSVIGFGGGLTNFFLWYDIFFPPYLNFLVAIGLIIFYYASTKNNLFNIKVIATEFFAYILCIVLLSRLVFANSFEEKLFNAVALIPILFISIQLTKSVRREVSQREKLEDLTHKLESANSKLKELDLARAEFISIASHQLRTPPATIKWYLAAIRSGDFGKINPRVMEAVKKTEMSNNTLISLIDDLLNVSRIERGKMEFLFEDVDLNGIIKEIVIELTPQAVTKKLKLNYQPPTGRNPSIVADREKLQQVVNNLIDNAIKYSDKGCVNIKLSRTRENYVISVTDAGKGMDRSEVAGLFSKFGRGKDSRHHAAGLGLGLYVAKVIIEHHHGKISADSKGLGKGSTFTVTLPLKTDLAREVEYDLVKAR
jgi:signal transduction histidine kinase